MLNIFPSRRCQMARTPKGVTAFSLLLILPHPPWDGGCGRRGRLATKDEALECKGIEYYRRVVERDGNLLEAAIRIHGSIISGAKKDTRRSAVSAFGSGMCYSERAGRERGCWAGERGQPCPYLVYIMSHCSFPWRSHRCQQNL